MPGNPAVISGDPRILMDALSQARTGIIISERLGSGSQYRAIYVNRAFETLTGYSAGELLGQGCGLLQGSETQQPAVEEMRRAVAEGRTCRVVVRNFRKDGSPFWNAMTLTPITDTSGEITHYLGVQQDFTDAYEGMERLSRSEASLREAQSIAHVGSWEQHYRTGEIRWTEEAFALFGYVPYSIQPSEEAFLASVHPDDRSAVQAEIKAAALRPDGRYAVEHRVLGPDGVPRILSAQGRVHFDEDGVPIRIAGVSLDITERRRVEDVLRAQEERYRMVVENIADLIIQTDQDGRFEFVSPSYSQLVGMEAQDLIGRDYLPLVHPDDREATVAAMAELQQPPHTCRLEHRVQTVRGERWLQWVDRALLDDRGRVSAIVAVGRDVTERRQAEREVMDREAMERELRDLSVACLEPMEQNVDQLINMALARTGRFTGADRAYVFWFDPDDGTFSNAHEWCADEGIAPMIDRLQNLPIESAPTIWRSLERGECVNITRLADLGVEQRAEQALLEMQGIRSLLMVPMQYAGQLKGAVGFDAVRKEREWTRSEIRFLEVFAGLLMGAISRDRVNHDLAAARQRETIGFLSSGVAHDFNNVLGVLDLNIRYLKKKFVSDSNDPEVVQVLEEIQSALGHAKVVALGMLSLGRGGSLRPERVPLGATIDEVVGICRPILPTSIRVQTEISQDLAVLSHAGFLQAAVLNLILNARDAMPRGGTLNIKIRRIRWDGDPMLQVGRLAPGEYAALTVSDTGEGMPPETLQRMFEPLFSTKTSGRGHGLGMYMVHEFVLGSRSGLSVESRIGKGTEFLFLIPLADTATATAAAPVRPPLDMQDGGARVLVVDDDPLIRESLRRQLHLLGIRSVCAENGSACLRILEFDRAFDLVVSDISMPEMDGQELLRILSVAYPDLPVVLMTGHDPSSVLTGPLPWAPMVLRKPLGISELNEALMSFGLLRPN